MTNCMMCYFVRTARITSLAMLFFAVTAVSQAAEILWGVSPFTNNYYQVDTTDGHFISANPVSMAGFTVNGLNSITIDPTTGKFYVIAKVDGSARRLATLEPVTGLATDIGSLGDNFSALTFDSSGQLWGETGDGATVPETLYQLDKASAAKVLFQTLGNGADGEMIAINPVDGLLYHWSGNGTIAYETVNLSTHAVTGIPLSGVQNGEIFGAVWSPLLGQFYTSNISSQLLTQTTAGFSVALGAATEDFRGLALQNTSPSGVPEPATMGLMVLGLGAVLIGHRRRRGSVLKNAQS